MRKIITLVTTVVLLNGTAAVARAAEIFAQGLQYPFGSTIGPGGDLYVADAAAGAIVRVDIRSGETSTYAGGLPISPVFPVFGLGGVMDVTFVDGVAYALVTLVSWDVGGTEADGVYRLEESGDWSVVADIGAFTLANPPTTAYDVPSGLQFAIECFRGGFLVTDGHHNRLMHVSMGGAVNELMQLDNVVPTGLAVRGDTVYLTEAGPVQYDPEDGKVLAVDPATWEVTELASGAPLLLDVKNGRGTKLLALSQGTGTGAPAGAPAVPNTGSLVEVNDDGTFTTIDAPLNLPASMQIVQNNAYIVSLDGNVYLVKGVSEVPFGR